MAIVTVGSSSIGARCFYISGSYPVLRLPTPQKNTRNRTLPKNSHVTHYILLQYCTVTEITERVITQVSNDPIVYTSSHTPHAAQESTNERQCHIVPRYHEHRPNEGHHGPRPKRQRGRLR